MNSLRLTTALLLLAAPWAAGQGKERYDGPRPAKADVPYLLHARKLVELDQATAREEKGKDGLKYSLPGASAQAKTPLMEPIFLMRGEKLAPEKMACYKMEVGKSGQRELTIPNKPKKDAGRARRMTVTQVADGLYRIELAEGLENGEYVLTPDGSNDTFSFSVY